MGCSLSVIREASIDSILFLNLSTFLLSLILAHDRDHGSSFLSKAFTSATAVLMVYLPPKNDPQKTVQKLGYKKDKKNGPKIVQKKKVH